LNVTRVLKHAVNAEIKTSLTPKVTGIRKERASNQWWRFSGASQKGRVDVPGQTNKRKPRVDFLGHLTRILCFECDDSSPLGRSRRDRDKKATPSRRTTNLYRLKKNRKAGFGPASQGQAETFSLSVTVLTPATIRLITGHFKGKIDCVNRSHCIKPRFSQRDTVVFLGFLHQRLRKHFCM